MPEKLLAASDVARSAGITLHRRGSRLWACCPIHQEKTPSMVFYPDGWAHCYGCGFHGDAADLYAAIYHTSLGEALRAVGKERTAKPAALSPGEMLRRRVEAHKRLEWDTACALLHAANALLTGRDAPDDPMLWNCLRLREKAMRRLDWLESATPLELTKDLVEGREHARLEPISIDGRGAERHVAGVAVIASQTRPASA